VQLGRSEGELLGLVVKVGTELGINDGRRVGDTLGKKVGNNEEINSNIVGLSLGLKEGS